VRQNVLHGELYNFVEELPKVQNVDVTNDKGRQEPVAQVHDVVMIKVVHDVFPFEFAIIVVRVHLLGHWLVQTVVKVPEEVPSLLWAQIEHEDQPAHVNNC